MIDKLIGDRIKENIAIKEALLTDVDLIKSISLIAAECTNSLKSGGQILFCGNGGSAADAQHLAAELAGRYYHDRRALNAEALHVNSSYLTAAANDYSYDEIFRRAIEAKARKGDILIAMSTSGKSRNVLNALHEANQRGVFTIGFCGMNGSEMAPLCKIIISVPSSDTPRIQEAHMLIGHIVCELIEKSFIKGI